MRARRHATDGESASPVAESDANAPSKSQRKRDMHDLQALGQALAELPTDRLNTIDMPDALRAAIDEYLRTRSHEGRRRQMQYIGKLMRQTDAEPLREAVAAIKVGSARDTLQLHQAERWRAELVLDDDAVSRWAATFPRSDLQQLRSLVRAARTESVAEAGQRHGRAWRSLFQFVKPHLAEVDSP